MNTKINLVVFPYTFCTVTLPVSRGIKLQLSDKFC